MNKEAKRSMYNARCRATCAGEEGFSIFSILATMAIVTILLSTAVMDMKVVNNPLADASFVVSRFLKLSRARAISQTTLITISPTSSRTLGAWTSETCDGTLSAIDNFSLELPKGASLVTTSWSVCFNQRGGVDDTVSFDLVDNRGETRTVEVALGGGSRIQ